jgi:large subunit ribosomal protein L21
MYAIVKTGGKQYKVAVGDTVKVELVVDGDNVTTDADALSKVTVTGEVVGHGKGPKIRIHHFRNKTGYHRRQGHRQPYTAIKVTGIDGLGKK